MFRRKIISITTEWEDQFKMADTSIIIFIFNLVFLFVANVFFTFAGIILNSVVILSLWNSQLRRKLCYFMIFILACFDLAVVAIVHPLVILRIIFVWVSKDFNLNNYYTFVSAFSATAYFTMTLERYLALLYPFIHEKSVTKSRLITAFMIFQLPFGILHIVELKGSNMAFLISTALFAVVLLATTILNLKLYYVARALRQRGVVTLGNFNGSNSEQRNVDMKIFKGTSASLGKISTCLLAVLCLFICNVASIVNAGFQIAELQLRDENIFIIDLWAETFFAVNSSLNCLIFFYKNSILRRHVQMFLKTFFLREAATP